MEGCCLALDQSLPTKGVRRALEVQGARGDAQLEIEIDGRLHRFVVQAHRGLHERNLGPLLHQSRELAEDGERLLVCTPRVPRKLGELLREHGVAYLDLGGNAYLCGDGLYVQIEGRAPLPKRIGRGKLTGTDYRLLGVYLMEEQAGDWTQAQLAKRAGIAIGAVGKGRLALAEQGLLGLMAPKRWGVADRAKGLQQFANGWAMNIRHKLRPQGFRLLNEKRHGDLETRLRKQGPGLKCLLGGERAAGMITQFLRTEYTTLHAQAGKLRDTAKALGLVPDDQGPITLLERYGIEDEWRLGTDNELAMVHPLLVWAECLNVPDERVAQTAKRLYDEFLVEPHG